MRLPWSRGTSSKDMATAFAKVHDLIEADARDAERGLDQDEALGIAASPRPFDARDLELLLAYAETLPDEMEMSGGAVLSLPHGWVPVSCLVMRAAPDCLRPAPARSRPPLDRLAEGDGYLARLAARQPGGRKRVARPAPRGTAHARRVQQQLGA
jgi:hypothetical protein